MKESNEGQTQCICGEKTTFRVKKPTAITPTITKMKCKKCKSTYGVKCVKIKGEFTFHFKELYLSPIAEQAAKKLIEEKLKEQHNNKNDSNLESFPKRDMAQRRIDGPRESG